MHVFFMIYICLFQACMGIMCQASNLEEVTFWMLIGVFCQFTSSVPLANFRDSGQRCKGLGKSRSSRYQQNRVPSKAKNRPPQWSIISTSFLQQT